MNLAFLSSYNGSSAKAISSACLNGELNASPTLLITNNKEAGALTWAEHMGLKTACLNSATHPDPQSLDLAIADLMRVHRIGLVILSGYMKLIGSETMRAVNGRIINIHPALLPAYGGQGMFGRHVHEAVKANNDIQTGITIHQVNEKYDEGKILAQKIIPITSADTAEDIESKVRAAEPDFYIETIRHILKGDIALG